jgi:hypothetical protein
MADSIQAVWDNSERLSRILLVVRRTSTSGANCRKKATTKPPSRTTKGVGRSESAMVEMLSISYSLQMYWSTVAHERAIRTLIGNAIRFSVMN